MKIKIENTDGCPVGTKVTNAETGEIILMLSGVEVETMQHFRRTAPAFGHRGSRAMTTIACVLRSGGDFTVRDVEQLRAGCELHMQPNDFNFVCLTDVVKPNIFCEHRPLRHNWPGWWSKMELFGLSDDVVICFDLDTVIVGDLKPLVDAVQSSPGLCLIRDFGRPNKMQSGIMAWAGNCDWPLRVFPPNVRTAQPWQFVRRHRGHELRDNGRTFRGDGEWLDAAFRTCRKVVTPLQDIVPGLYSYKHHVRPTGKLPGDAAVVCFHGRPRPRELEPKPEWMT